MPTVALIGPDGAGKTTIARRLEESGLLRCRYLYMGVSASSSNLALPTTRLAQRVHRDGPIGPPRRKGLTRRTVRLLNRLADAWYRQLASWALQARGYTVIYDRHFALDYAREVAPPGPESLDRRLHRWLVTHAYPRPHLVIFLDAPGDVLFARKGELDPEELERRRQAFLSQGERLPAFLRVDATRPLDGVFQEVARAVLTLSVGNLKRAERAFIPGATPSPGDDEQARARGGSA